jgi:hypothetical protein
VEVFNKILVPVAGTDADNETVKLACRLAKRDKSVVTVKRALPAGRGNRFRDKKGRGNTG